MSQNNNNKDTGKLSTLDCLTDFLADSEDHSSEEVVSELKSKGIKIDQLMANVESFVADQIEESKRGWMKVAHKNRDKQLKELQSINIKIPANFEELKEKVRQLIVQEPAFAGAYFKNFNDQSKEDLESLYIAFQKLKLIGKEQKDDNK